MHCGPVMASRTEKILSSRGIDPDDLVELDTKGNNARIFSYDGKFLVKVNNGFETYGSEPVKHPLILGTIVSTRIGADHGGAPVFLQICPELSTESVTDAHVEALCYELAKAGLVFSDNKLENVGLATFEGAEVPYVIDQGAVEADGPETKYYYPKNSGKVEKTGEWKDSTVNHLFEWPASQTELQEYRKAEETLGALLEGAKSIENSILG